MILKMIVELKGAFGSIGNFQFTIFKWCGNPNQRTSLRGRHVLQSPPRLSLTGCRLSSISLNISDRTHIREGSLQRGTLPVLGQSARLQEELLKVPDGVTVQQEAFVTNMLASASNKGRDPVALGEM